MTEMGTALFESLIMNHPAIDGNKRVAFFGIDVFFRLNGYLFEVNANDAHMFLIGLIEAGNCYFENLLPGVQDSIVPLK